MNIGIIGHEAAKFTPAQKERALSVICQLLEPGDAVLVSGRSPLGGVDVWAEDMAKGMGRDASIHAPTTRQWDGPGGFKERNLAIARDSEMVCVIVVEKLPDGFKGRTFNGCYHCHDERPLHVKSGACWTAIQAQRLGKKAWWTILE